MNKIKSIDQAIDLIKPGMTVMIGGFLGVGTPEKLVDGLVDRGVKDLVIVGNDTAFPDRGIGRLVVNKQAKKVIVSHIGTNPETGRQMNEGELEVELVPQGTLAERIRCAGAGLGGFLTPTGLGTVVEEGKKKIETEDGEYLLELPLKADIALIKGHRVDKKGNVCYSKTARNFNPIMAMAADVVIVEADEIVETGDIDPESVATPGLLVDMIVTGGCK